MNTIILFLTLASILLISIKPKIGVYLIAICLPIIGSNLYLFGLVIPIIDFVALITLIAFFANFFYIRIFKSSEQTKLNWPIFLPFLLFFIANLLSTFFADKPLESFYYFLRWPFFLYFAYIFVPYNIIKDIKTLKKTIILVFLSSMLVLLSGYLSLYGQDWQNNFFRMKSLFIFGSYPFGENHNLIAEFLNIGVFFVLVIKEFIKEKRQKRIIDIIFALSAVGIIATFSRTGWITLILQLAIYLYYKTKYDKKERLGIIMLILFSAVMLSPLLWKMSVLQDNNTSSTENRLLLTEISLKAFEEKPLFGQGSGQFINLVENDIRFTAKYGSPIDSHGVIQKVLAENGVVGLLSLFFIFVYLLRFCFLAIKKYYPKVKWVLPFALAALGGIFFQFFNTSYYKGKVWFPLMLFMLAVNFSEQLYDKKNKDSSHPAKS
ncbi:MAG: O-antigen ligase family protein [Patescibacteria group bacterium]